MKDIILHRKDRLIISTIEVIDELGIQGLSTREIARREGVSEATLFRHYKNKNELIRAVLEYYSQFDEDIFNTTKIKGLPPKEAIIYYIGSIAEYYENYPAITSILQIFDVLRYEPDLADQVEQISNVRYQILTQLIEEAQRNNEIQSFIDVEVLSTILSGTCREICLKWRLDKKQFSLKEKTLLATKNILDAFSPERNR